MAHSAQTFRELADERLTEAQLLLANDRPSGAYYLAGYAIEFALKAKIATRFLANEIPDKVLVIKVHDHDFNKLLQLANLGDEDYATLNTDTELRRWWTIAAKWKPDSRYKIWSLNEATDLVEAVGGDRGLMQWLRNL
ncbi:MAG: hypothetical protein JWQ51_48 [Tardiphaga sp.]|jgi:hypothetical protein|nr:hypothetical protein [Tardiphaga sp.]